MTIADEILLLCEEDEGVELAPDSGKAYSKYKAQDRLASMVFDSTKEHHREYVRGYMAYLCGKGKMPDDSKVGHRTAEHLRSHVKQLWRHAYKQ